MEVEVRGKECTAGPLPIGILMSKQLSSKPFIGDASSSLTSHTFGLKGKVSLYLPPEGGVGVQHPIEGGEFCHGERIYPTADVRY